MISSHPKVSIITPSFQQAKFLPHCIESVLSQDYPNIEYYIFDGGSTDESLNIIKKYASLHSFYWESKPDNGQAHAINKGLKIAKGEILCYLNSDDTLLPGTISKIVNHWQQSPETDLLYGKAHYTSADGKFSSDYLTKPFEPNSFFGDCYICQPAAFWHKRISEKIGLFDESLHAAFDYDFWIRIYLAGGKIEHLEEYLATSRDYPQTKTRSLRGLIFKENFKINQKHLQFIHPRWIESWLAHIKVETNRFSRHFIPTNPHTRLRLSIFLAKLVSRRKPPYYEWTQ